MDTGSDSPFDGLAVGEVPEQVDVVGAAPKRLELGLFEEFGNVMVALTSGLSEQSDQRSPHRTREFSPRADPCSEFWERSPLQPASSRRSLRRHIPSACNARCSASERCWLPGAPSSPLCSLPAWAAPELRPWY